MFWVLNKTTQEPAIAGSISVLAVYTSYDVLHLTEFFSRTPNHTARQVLDNSRWLIHKIEPLDNQHYSYKDTYKDT
ncbi:MAG: hypothetical protein H8D45_08030 [Bacteroidetes bacterium]|nr:hypothetical protein [Bacteroidota bacterium]